MRWTLNGQSPSCFKALSSASQAYSVYQAPHKLCETANRCSVMLASVSIAAIWFSLGLGLASAEARFLFHFATHRGTYAAQHIS